MTISTVVVNAGTRCISGKPRFFKAIENIGRTPHEECNDLVAANSILDQLDTRSPLRSGLMNVSISDIVGSVGRFQDFRLDFSPRHDFSADRIRYFINMIERRDRLPPVLLYKVGSALFVV
ncbi:MAG: hypothetical protein R3335_08150, partial [Anaerolineales bacterium]|nr:hypothetical protein [Anaerolineales bacterium]